MSLIGRLEDLPVSDILRIIYLSRGTGVLEISRQGDRHTVLFRRGLILNVSTPADPSLRTHLEQALGASSMIGWPADRSAPIGMAVLQMNVVAAADLGKIIFKRVSELIAALCTFDSGEFSFRAGEPGPTEVEYDPKTVFRHGGILPEKLLGKNPPQLATIQSLKESLAAGKRPSATEEAPASTPSTPARKPAGTVVVLDDDARSLNLMRDALVSSGFEVVVCSCEDVRERVADLLNSNQSFAAVLGIDSGAQQVPWRVLDLIKARDPRLPVAVLDREASFRRRHIALQAGADLYLTKPQTAKETPDGRQEELALFAEDIVVFASRQLQKIAPALGPRDAAPTDKERMYRGFRLLMQLISEVSEPNDISQLALTILHLATDYVDRGVLFAVTANEYATLGRFGLTGAGAAGLRVRRGAMAVLDRVLESRQPYRGSVDVTMADHQLLESFGGQPPSEIVVLPIVNGEEIVGLLYGDNALNRRTIDDTVGLEVFLSQSGSVFQNAILASRNRGALAAV